MADTYKVLSKGTLGLKKYSEENDASGILDKDIRVTKNLYTVPENKNVAISAINISSPAYRTVSLGVFKNGDTAHQNKTVKFYNKNKPLVETILHGKYSFQKDLGVSYASSSDLSYSMVNMVDDPTKIIAIKRAPNSRTKLVLLNSDLSEIQDLYTYDDINPSIIPVGYYNNSVPFVHIYANQNAGIGEPKYVAVGDYVTSIQNKIGIHYSVDGYTWNTVFLTAPDIDERTNQGYYVRMCGVSYAFGYWIFPTEYGMYYSENLTHLNRWQSPTFTSAYARGGVFGFTYYSDTNAAVFIESGGFGGGSLVTMIYDLQGETNPAQTSTRNMAPDGINLPWPQYASLSETNSNVGVKDQDGWKVPFASGFLLWPYYQSNNVFYVRAGSSSGTMPGSYGAYELYSIGQQRYIRGVSDRDALYKSSPILTDTLGYYYTNVERVGQVSLSENYESQYVLSKVMLSPIEEKTISVQQPRIEQLFYTESFNTEQAIAISGLSLEAGDTLFTFTPSVTPSAYSTDLIASDVSYQIFGDEIDVN